MTRKARIPEPRGREGPIMDRIDHHIPRVLRRIQICSHKRKQIHPRKVARITYSTGHLIDTDVRNLYTFQVIIGRILAP